MAFKTHLKQVKQWLAEQENIKVLNVDYNRTIKEPKQTARKLNNFLDRELNIEKMASVVDPSLYRSKKNN